MTERHWALSSPFAIQDSSPVVDLPRHLELEYWSGLALFVLVFAEIIVPIKSGLMDVTCYLQNEETSYLQGF